MKRRHAFAPFVVAAVLALASCAPAQEAATPQSPTQETPAPEPAGPFDFVAETTHGGTLDGTTLMGKDVVLWFWAPWCPTCLVEGENNVAPALEQFPEGVEFVGIAGSITSDEEIATFLEFTGTGDATHVLDRDGSIWKGFGVVLQPAFYFVNDDGTARRAGAGMSTEDILREAEALTTK